MTSNVVKLMIYTVLCVFCRPYREEIPGSILIDRKVIRDNKANNLWSDSRLIAKTQAEQSCERASKEKHGVHSTRWENILDTPFEAIMRLFIMTIGEFTIFYRSLNTCEERMMQMIGKFLFTIFELFISIMQLNLLIAMMTRTYETISRTSTEWKRQWAQVIPFLKLSLKLKERLIAMMKYSRPIGTDKTKRSFVVVRKTTDFGHTPDGRRPVTSYGQHHQEYQWRNKF
uniref:Ion_trans domain-containing protein n=1 Tax=Onchocerca volvulus TaxID=6282 RepID=A0A8R1TWU2_ONCVO